MLQVSTHERTWMMSSPPLPPCLAVVRVVLQSVVAYFEITIGPPIAPAGPAHPDQQQQRHNAQRYAIRHPSQLTDGQALHCAVSSKARL